MIKKIVLIFDTIKYLKFKQIYFRIYYSLRNRFRKVRGFRYPLAVEVTGRDIVFLNSIPALTSYEKGVLTFLNLSHQFDTNIDWNFAKYGKLWTYNLSYFDFLNQKNIEKNEGLRLIYDFIDNVKNIKDGLEPYPTSLRGINWIKFLTKYKIKDKKIDGCLYAQYHILLDNLEYHLLGNHLLENGFSLLFGAYYFQDEVLYKKAVEILKTELEEQVLDDGGHFELSPMYHQIMLFRVLDCLNLVQNNQWIVDSRWLIELLREKAEKMLGWLNAITYEDGTTPLFNDSANKIAPSTQQLKQYALMLNLKFNIQNSKLSKSGYRKITKQRYECIVDIGDIQADYIPGHTHADTFNFVLNIKNNHQPFIIDTGVSTYEAGDIRDYERSTKSHNTVEINNTNSSEVWRSFRVANRAKNIKSEENKNHIKATHDGYFKKFRIFHTREWFFYDDKIIVKDSLNKGAYGVFRLHFHPEIGEEEIKERIRTNNNYKITDCFVAFEYNKRIKSKALEIKFEKHLEVEILV